MAGRRQPRPAIRQRRHLVAPNGDVIPLTIRHHPRARRLTLRVPVRGEGAIVTLPPGATEDDALRLADCYADWLCRRLAARPRPVAFADGIKVPLLGAPHCIRHAPGRAAGVAAGGGVIEVGGPAAELPGRVGTFLRAEALREIRARVCAVTDGLGLAFGRIRIGDPRSRWGSCSSQGNLFFSWRLILAPPPVLGYVVAHEVAHLAVPNHGPQFRRLVEALVPDADGPRAWLGRHGPELHRYG
jgi:hypothetical protein